MSIDYQEGPVTRRTTATFFRGEHANFFPSDDSINRRGFVESLVAGLVPAAHIIDKSTRVVAFGSCFAANISRHLHARGYNVLTKKDAVSYVSRMGDGIVNTFAILQQFEWAWEGKQPKVDLWHGFDAQALGYDEPVRLKTKALFDSCEMFVITFGLSEIWYDKPTGEVFWRAVPTESFDATRHKFRVATHAENLRNIQAIYSLIRTHRPDASIVFTLSPVPLTATFRPISATVASAASKASLRGALDEFFAAKGIHGAYYFPSYEIVLDCFENRFMEDRKHVHQHILDFVMVLFERYFAGVGNDDDVWSAFGRARRLDKRVGRYGHWSVHRTMSERKGLTRKAPPLHIRVVVAFEKLFRLR